MALNINGTTGISGVDGSASAPALQGTDSNTGINFASDTVNINTGGSTRATVDSAGRLLLGTTTEGHGEADNFTIGGSGSVGMTIRSTDSNSSRIYFSDATSGGGEQAGALIYRHGTNALEFYTNESERMRVDSSGRVGIGTSSPAYRLDIPVSGAVAARFQQTTNNQGEDHACIILRHAAATSSAQGVGMLFQNSGGSTVGSIKFGASTSYNTSSDYRLKENVTAISDGITRLKTLKPKRFNFIADAETTVDGFLAHEVTPAVPEAITGTKDEVDSDNNPVYQGIDQSKLVPLLTAALQEAVAKIEVLETKVAALEAG
jgi:hypothetical protein